ncbi:uncharacterized protein LOC103696051 [Phoenix dactylifera]|uniref:Uncharacterized protein LOC103696051 n=1 Tax=Phoenix dactylifera TaxID=42345 RepID=A0A8B7BFS6_PHODC|nr:uncharacterized protein LOC103696051 [Phoenix dactylifera]
MRARWKRSAHFLCFGAVDPAEEEAAVKTRDSSAGSCGRIEILGTEARRHRRRLAKIFRSAMFVSALNRSKEEGKHSDCSAARKASVDKRAAEWSEKFSYGDDRTADAIFSSSSWTSSSTSSSSCLSSASSSWFREPEPKPKPEFRQKRASPMAESRNHPPPARGPARNYGSATGFFFLLLSLSVMVFCGRLYAILWTSSWLCFVPPRNVAATGSPELRRKGIEEIEKKRIILEGFLERNRRV